MFSFLPQMIQRSPLPNQPMLSHPFHRGGTVELVSRAGHPGLWFHFPCPPHCLGSILAVTFNLCPFWMIQWNYFKKDNKQINKQKQSLNIPTVPFIAICFCLQFKITTLHLLPAFDKVTSVAGHPLCMAELPSSLGLDLNSGGSSFVGSPGSTE
jgi:hypothetical protein